MSIDALTYILKTEGWPLSRDAPNWMADSRAFRAQARRRLAPSMRRRIVLAGLYADARNGLPETMDGQAPLPPECPLTLGDLLSLDP